MIWKPISAVVKNFNELKAPQFKFSFVRAKKKFSSKNVRSMLPSEPSLRGEHGGNLQGIALEGDIGRLNVHAHLFGPAMVNIRELTIFFSHHDTQHFPALPREVLASPAGWFMMGVPEWKWEEFKNSFEIISPAQNNR